MKYEVQDLGGQFGPQNAPVFWTFPRWQVIERWERDGASGWDVLGLCWDKGTAEYLCRLLNRPVVE